jgi:hypothetical protein
MSIYIALSLFAVVLLALDLLTAPKPLDPASHRPIKDSRRPV